MSEIRLVQEDFNSFFETPFSIYPKFSPFVSVFKDDLKRFLDRTKNPLFLHAGELTYFTAFRGKKPVGRITAHTHTKSDAAHGWRRGYFGYFDCADDPEGAHLLLKASRDWSRAKGAKEHWGAFNLTAMQQIGIVESGFDQTPFTDQVYGPAYLPRLLLANGYQASFPMATFEIDLDGLNPDILKKGNVQAALARSDLRWEKLTRKSFEVSIEAARITLNDGFSKNPLFVPLTSEEFMFQAKDMMWIIDERLSSIVYQGDEPLGVVVCIPDLNPFLRATRSRLRWDTLVHFARHRLSRRRAVIIYYSVKEKVHGQGLAGGMLHHVMTALKKAQYKKLGITWIAESNVASLRQMEKLGARKIHGSSLYSRSTEE